MSNLEITPSPTPCSKFCSHQEFFDCAVCGWNEEAHYLNVRSEAPDAASPLDLLEDER